MSIDRRVDLARLDPALAVSGLLTRLALFLLVVMAPIIAMISRRAVAVLIPIATALLILAAALDGHLPAAFRKFAAMAMSRQALALMALIVWAAVSLLWTPRTGEAAGRLSEIAAILILFTLAIACMRPRTRRSDVNLIPVGAGIAAITLAIECLPHSPWPSLGGDGAETRIETQRAAMLVALLIWPAAAALIAQSRAWLAVVLGIVTLAALWLVRDLVVLGAFIAGAVVFAFALWRPRSATVGVGGAIVAMIILAPLIGWLMARYGGFLLPRAGDELVGIWRDVTFSLPSRLVQGFGFDSSGALERGVGGALLGSPRNAALQIWLELGLVGVVLAVAAAVFAASGVERLDGRARAATLGVAASAAVIMFAGSAAWQNWWMTELGLTAIALAFLSRRSRREAVQDRS